MRVQIISLRYTCCSLAGMHIDSDCIGHSATGYMLLVWLFFSIFWLIYGPLFKADTTCNIIVLMVSNLLATPKKIVKNSTQSRVSRDRKKVSQRHYHVNKSALYISNLSKSFIFVSCPTI